MTLYGALLRLYPRAFREEYGEDMRLLLRQQRRDEGAVRVCGRTLLDLALTVPQLHLEVRMKRSPSAAVLYGNAAVASLVLAAVVGTALGLTVLGLALALLFGSLAAVALRRGRTLGEARHAAAHWWHYLAAGAAGLVVLAVIGNAVGELPEGTWFVFMAGLLTSFVLLATGVVLGLVRLTSARRTA